MVTLKQVADVALWPSRQVTGPFLHLVSWKLPDYDKKELRDQDSPFRLWLDSSIPVGVAAGLVTADYFAGVDIGKPIAHFYQNSRFLATSVTLGGTALFAEYVNRVYDMFHPLPVNLLGLPATAETHKFHAQIHAQNIARIATPAALLVALGFGVASLELSHPVGIRTPPEQLEKLLRKQIDAQLAPIKEQVTAQEDKFSQISGRIDNYLEKVVQPELEKKLSDLSAQQRKEIADYVNQTVPTIIGRELQRQGYVTAQDVDKAVSTTLAAALMPYVKGADLDQLLGKLTSLDGRVQGLEAAAKPTPTSTAVPTPAASSLSSYSTYSLPKSVAQAAFKNDPGGLASVLGASTDVLSMLFDTVATPDNPELIRMDVTRTSVSVVENVGNNKWYSVPLKKAVPATLTKYLETKLTPQELNQVSGTR